jgi:hypothetical protein
VKEIETTLFSIIDSVKGNPFPVGRSDGRGPQLITASDIDVALHMALHFPLESATQLFQAMHNLSLGDGSWFADNKRNSMISDTSALPENCTGAPPWTPECQALGVFDSIGGMGIECTDGINIQDRSSEAFKAYWDFLSNSSRVTSRKAKDRLVCTHWEIRPKWMITGELEFAEQLGTYLSDRERTFWRAIHHILFSSSAIRWILRRRYASELLIHSL